MIVPMKKVYLVILERDREEVLVGLRELGLVHLETKRASGEEYERMERDRDLLAGATNIVPRAKNGDQGSASTTEEAIGLAHRVIELDRRTAEVQMEIGEIEAKLERAAPWGDWNPADIEYLRSNGLSLRFYLGDESALASASEKMDLILLSRAKKTVRVVIVRRLGESAEQPKGLVEVKLEETSSSLGQRLAEKKAELASIRAQLEAAALETKAFSRAALDVEERMSFISAKASFTREGPVCYVKGFVPATSLQFLTDMAAKKSWVVLDSDPDGEDVTPTKVENNRFVRMIQPVFDFLGIVPGYNEYEISSLFLGFFVLFSAMIFGDGGYGLLMLFGCLWASLKYPRRGKPIPDILRLFILIAACTTAWGTLTGTWFSIRAERLPNFLLGLAIWPLSSANPEASKNVQILCFTLGALQISIARIKNIIRDFPKLTFIAQLGSLALIWGMYFLVLNLVVDSKRFPVPPWAVYLIAGGFAAGIIFGAYEGNILKSMLEGLKNIIPSFLGSVGVFADIVSYIRLWALGLAGSSLAAIINKAGGGLFKAVAMAAAGLAILLAGHTLNVVLSALSVIVHAIRLNILEFSCNHLGMQWSGVKYAPFRKIDRELD